ncbi:glutamine amidotransferase [Chondromyces apiculatus]|uniref:Threonine dehydrogenase and Zn-dependent dehydrogenase n=1 Tax=Chondromyces apiculatus DSM 436 TaxID=1192034 RepID=A0A017TIA8_9BACT|nr:glutamine amidotransferase [Chondromyces apiculatus]EYF08550.1 Threonine dehydrogenase and Zn-dependent dehydrogenase [Chondromyces apiculatus DSM 436]
MSERFALTGDLSTTVVVIACALAALSLGLLGAELWQRRKVAKRAVLLAVSGVVAVLGLLLAVLRPVAVTSRGHTMGPRVVVLTDVSRSMDLPGSGGTRRDAATRALEAMAGRSGVRFSVFGFGEGAPVPLSRGARDARDGEGTQGSRAPESGASGQGAAGKAGATPGAPGDARLDPRGGTGAQEDVPIGAAVAGVRPALRSDLGAALEATARAPDERPAAIVVISDGRLDRPTAAGAAAETRAALEPLSLASEAPGGGTGLPPVHTLAVATEGPPDASVRAVRAAGAAVAHQPVTLRVEVGCSGGLTCEGALPIAVRELREEGEPTLLASGESRVDGGQGTVELPITLDRAGTRILEVKLKAPDGDRLPENDTRYVAVDVARDRIRVLHVAGRPTYDVRALRMWLKSDASVDVVAFFILRTPTDKVKALSDELALIPFPVDELFNVHLPSFDAVVLQDFDAEPYGLTKHLPSLGRYVDRGGGLIMVGGPDAFVGGHYGRSAVARVLPVSLDIGEAQASDLASFTPRLTPAGQAAPVLKPLLDLIGPELPEMPGTSVVGEAMPGASVLLTHPERKTPRGAPMPVLALGEHGSGRTIALTVDGSHRLLFSAFAQSSAGRAHGAFWDALLGWLMRDPRFEPATIAPKGGCIAGEPTTLVLRTLGLGTGQAEGGERGDQGGPGNGAIGGAIEAVVTIKRLGSAAVVRTLRAKVREAGEVVELPAGVLEPGGYAATVEVVQAGAEEASAGGAAPGTLSKGPATRRDFACERGGEEWADSRPDPERLKAIADATGGKALLAADAEKLPLPEGTQVLAERQVSALAPPWVWTLMAAAALGLHWITRRRAGLA